MIWGHTISVNLVDSTRQRELQDMLDAGANCVRINDSTTLANLARTMGFKNHAAIVGGTVTTYPNLTTFGQRCVSWAQQYPEAFIEPGNEQNFQWTVAQVAAFQKAVYSAVKNAGLPNAVWLSSIGNGPSSIENLQPIDWARGLVANGCTLGNGFDVANYHGYGEPVSYEKYLHIWTPDASGQSMQSIFGNPPFVATEFGAAMSSVGGNETTQDTYIKGWMNLLLQQPKFIGGHQYAMSADAPGSGTDYGLRRHDLTRRPAFTSYRIIATSTPAPPPPPPPTSSGSASARSNIVGPAALATFSTARSNVVGPAAAADTAPPTVSLTAPTNGVTVSGSVTISASASDTGSGVATVEFLVDGSVIGSDTSSPFSFTWNAAQALNGTHTITARATDKAGNSATSTARTVTVTGGLLPGVPHRSELFPALAFEVDFAEDTLSRPYSAAVIGDLPYFYYRATEASSATAPGDASPNNRTGTWLNGSSLTFQQASPVAANDFSVAAPAGSVSLQRGLRGNDTSGATHLTSGGITLEALFRPDAFPTTGKVPIFSGGSGGETLYLDSTGALVLGSTVVPGGTLTLGTWYHLAETVEAFYHVGWQDSNGNDVYVTDWKTRVYLNGKQLGVFGTGTQNQWTWGTQRTFSYTLSAGFDEFAYYDQVLTATQIAAHIGSMNSTYGGVPTAWVDLTPKLRSLDTARGRASETVRVDPGETDAQLEDTTRALEPDYSGSPYFPNVVPQRLARFRATKDNVTYDLARFYVETWPVDWTLRRGIASIRGTDLMGVLGTWKISGKFVQQLTGARINTYLDRIGWPAGARLIDPGAETMIAETLAAESALAAFQLAADTENGVVFVDGSGNFVFHDKNHRLTATRSITPQAVFGDGGPATNELPYVSIALDLPDDQIWNEITVTYGDPGRGQQTATAVDSTSQRRFGVRSLPARETRLTTVAAAQAQADAILARYKDPHVRFSSVTLDPTRYPGLWAAALGAEISDRVWVVRRPYAGGAPIAKAAWIERVAHRVAIPNEGRNSWQAVVELTTV